MRHPVQMLIDERDTLRAQLDEAVALLRRAQEWLEAHVPDHIATNPDHPFGEFDDDARAFLSRLDADGKGVR